MEISIKKTKVFTKNEESENNKLTVHYGLEKKSDSYLLTLELSDINAATDNPLMKRVINSTPEVFKDYLDKEQSKSIYVPSFADINIEEAYYGVCIDVHYPADELSDMDYLTDDVYESQDEYGNECEVGDIGVSLMEIQRDEDNKNSIMLEFKSFNVINEQNDAFYLWNSLIEKNIYEEIYELFI